MSKTITGPIAMIAELTMHAIITVTGIQRRTVDSAVLLHSNGEQLLCVGDLFYDPLQLSHPQWPTPWDHDTARAVRARRRLLDRAADEHLLIHAYHIPFPGLGTIFRHGDAYSWQPLLHDEPQHTRSPVPEAPA
jgi:glyoxylase-like metal-dependent hydrolase (beta-lactamase superfamily II)